MPPIPKPPFYVSPLVAYLIASVSTIAGLLATQGLIHNGWERTISAVAAIVFPIGYLVVNALAHKAESKVVSARIIAGMPAQDRPPIIP